MTISSPCSPEEGVLIQKKYLAELKKWLTADEIELAISDKRLFFRTGDQRETFTLPLSLLPVPPITTTSLPSSVTTMSPLWK